MHECAVGKGLVRSNEGCVGVRLPVGGDALKTKTAQRHFSFAPSFRGTVWGGRMGPAWPICRSCLDNRNRRSLSNGWVGHR